MSESRVAVNSNTSPLARRAAGLVVSQRIEDGRAIGSAGDLLRKGSENGDDGLITGGDEMTVTSGMEIRNVNMGNVDVAISVAGGCLSGMIRTSRTIRVTGGHLSGYIETSGDVIISGGTVEGVIIADRIAIRGTAKVSGVCVSNSVAFKDGVSVQISTMSQAAATADWRRAQMLSVQEG